VANASVHRPLEPRGRTGGDLLRLWEWAGQSGRMNPSTANQYRTACARILASLPAGEDSDVLAINVDDAVARFYGDNADLLSKGTLATYGSIFVRAVQSLEGFLNEPHRWEPPVAYTKRPRRRVVAASISSTGSVSRGAHDLPTVRRIQITLPSGGVAEITLPDGTTPNDVRFLARVLPAYAGDDLA
jgi:hypothetical protein